MGLVTRLNAEWHSAGVIISQAESYMPLGRKINNNDNKQAVKMYC